MKYYKTAYGKGKEDGNKQAGLRNIRNPHQTRYSHLAKRSFKESKDLKGSFKKEGRTTIKEITTIFKIKKGLKKKETNSSNSTTNITSTTGICNKSRGGEITTCLEHFWKNGGKSTHSKSIKTWPNFEFSDPPPHQESNLYF